MWLLQTHLAQVATHPHQINTTLAIASPFFLYDRGGLNRKGPPASPVKVARCVANTTVKRIAEESVKMHASTEHAFHATRTAYDSCLSGQKRSKKKAAPKMVATKTPTNMLYEKAPTISLLETEIWLPSWAEWPSTYRCWLI